MYAGRGECGVVDEVKMTDEMDIAEVRLTAELVDVWLLVSNCVEVDVGV